MITLFLKYSGCSPASICLMLPAHLFSRAHSLRKMHKMRALSLIHQPTSLNLENTFLLDLVLAVYSLRRDDHSSRGVLLTVVHRVWSRNLNNEVAMPRVRLQRHSKKKNWRYTLITVKFNFLLVPVRFNPYLTLSSDYTLLAHHSGSIYFVCCRSNSQLGSVTVCCHRCSPSHDPLRCFVLNPQRSIVRRPSQ